MSRLSSALVASSAAAALLFLTTNRAVSADAADSTTTTADASASLDASSAANAAAPAQLGEIQVTAQRLNEARTSIETQIGASTYTIDAQAIAAMPGGDNASLNQVLLQAPDVVLDSFGQIHVRGDHNDLQYRLNGVILPEGISVFSQTLSPRLISSVKLITGALPAEYGLRTAGIIDLTTNSGQLHPGGYLSVYGGSHSTFQPALEASGGKGALSYYLAGDYKRSNLGIDSPDGSSDPLHDHTTQIHGFGYLEDILDSSNRLSLILGISDDEFQIPNQRDLKPTLGLNVQGQTQFPSDNLNETQHELAEYAIATWQHSEGALNVQTSISARYTSLHFAPDWVGDLLYNGVAQDAFKSDTAMGWQTDAAYQAGAAHTVRMGFYFQHDDAKSETTSQVLPIDPNAPPPPPFAQTSTIPLTIEDNGTQTQWIESVYLQDEWRPLSPLTINYGVRYDHYTAYSNGNQWSPRVNAVWEFGSGTILHGGYSRYFTPPPFELIASTDLTKFHATTALPPGAVTLDTPPIAARANYYDLGVQQKFLDQGLTIGVDSFYEQAQHLIDEGQFGAPIILTPFNYRYGLIGGIEFTANYTLDNLSAYLNSAWQAAHGKEWESSQFNFTQTDIDYVGRNYIHLDHEGRVSASGGVSYLLGSATRLSADAIFGSGLRQALILPDGSDIPNGDHTASYAQINFGASHAFQVAGSGPLTVRFDVINVTDKIYQIRSGTGVGVFAPQYGPRRGFFGGLAWKF
jgi:outer membrane receptor protein involved in Fe transport